MPGYGPTPPPGWPTNRPWPPTSKADLTLLGLLGRDVTRASKGLAEAFKSIPGLAKEFYDYAKENPVRAGLDLTPPGAAVESILMGGKAGQALATGGAKIALPMLGMAMLGTHTGGKLPKFRSAAIKLADGSIYEGALHFNAVEEAMSAMRNGKPFPDPIPLPRKLITPPATADDHIANLRAVGEHEVADNLEKYMAGSKVRERLFHATGAAQDFAQFKRKQNDVGIHLGTAGQAEDRLSYTRRGLTDPLGEIMAGSAGLRTVPVFASIKRPLRLPDLGSWGSENLSYELPKHGFNPGSINQVLRSGNESGRVTGLRDLMASPAYAGHGGKNYDGIVYSNTGETAGGEAFVRAEDAARKPFIDRALREGKHPGVVSPEMQEWPEYKAYVDSYNAQHKFRADNAQDSYIAFNPRQIKSATGNRGTFDPRDPRLTYGLTGIGLGAAALRPDSLWSLLGRPRE